MINKDSFPVYAQYNEDIVLAALLYKIKKGFYVDVGANEEDTHSVTKYFYKRGWSGINIEPIPRLAEALSRKRPRDITLQLAISSKKGKLKFREYPSSEGLSTLSRESMNEKSKTGLSHTDYDVATDTLSNIFDKHATGRIDFLKIDVEGYEQEVLKSNDWNKYRPTVLCIESYHRTSDWSDYVKSKNYNRVIFDGLNEYYIAAESKGITDGFADRATLLAHNAIRQHHVQAWKADLKRIKFLEDFTDRQDALIKSTQKSLNKVQDELERIAQLSLKNKGYKARLAAAIKGLTIDYYRYKSRR